MWVLASQMDPMDPGGGGGGQPSTLVEAFALIEELRAGAIAALAMNAQLRAASTKLVAATRESRASSAERVEEAEARLAAASFQLTEARKALEARPSSLPTAAAAARKARATAASASARRNEGHTRKQLATLTKENTRLRSIVKEIQEEKRRVVASHRALVSAVSKSARKQRHGAPHPAASAAARPASAQLHRAAAAAATEGSPSTSARTPVSINIPPVSAPALSAAAAAPDCAATPLGSSPTELRQWMGSGEGSPSTVALNLLSGFGAPPSPATPLEAPRGYTANPHVSPTRFSPSSIPLPPPPSTSAASQAGASGGAAGAAVRVNRHGSVSISMPR